MKPNLKLCSAPEAAYCTGNCAPHRTTLLRYLILNLMRESRVARILELVSIEIQSSRL